MNEKYIECGLCQKKINNNGKVFFPLPIFCALIFGYPFGKEICDDCSTYVNIVGAIIFIVFLVFILIFVIKYLSA